MTKQDKDRKKDRPKAVKATPSGSKAAAVHTAGHAPAKPHGRPATVDTSLPATREELLVRHFDARRRRAAAPLGSEAFREAVDELGRIEIRIAAIEQDQTQPGN
jgi:hypothetical protein